MLLFRNSEMFYTGSQQATDEDDLVDQISIDRDSKEYYLQKNVGSHVTDGYLSDGYAIISYYVSRFVFDIIVEGVKRAGFKEAVYVR